MGSLEGAMDREADAHAIAQDPVEITFVGLRARCCANQLGTKIFARFFQDICREASGTTRESLLVKGHLPPELALERPRNPNRVTGEVGASWLDTM